MGPRVPLVKKLLLVDGISRSGKFVLANILNGLRDIEPVQYSGMLEHIPFLSRFGLIERRTAKELLHHEVDIRCYEMLIGRTLNHRVSDKSAIFNVADHEQYLRRSTEEDTDAILRSFYERQAYSFFLTHETLPDMGLFFEAFPELSLINLRRSPVDLVYAWSTRYAMDAWGKDPKFFNIPIEGKKGNIPWFMYGKEDAYEQLAPMDRAIFCIEALFKAYEEAEASLSLGERERTLLVRYEDILERTAEVIGQASTFLGKEPSAGMADILTRLHLPNPGYSKGKKESRIAHIRAEASSVYMEKLLALEEKYFA